MSKKQSRRDFWRWWREQAEIERTIKVWPYADEWFWRAPHRMSGRAATRHEAMADAKAALRMKAESESRLRNDLYQGVRALTAGLSGAREAIGRSAFAMGQAVGSAVRLNESMKRFAETAAEYAERIEVLQPPDFGLGATRSDIIQAEQAYGFDAYYRGRGK